MNTVKKIRKKTLIELQVVTMILFVTTNGIAQQTYDEQVEQYIAQYKPIAIEEMQRMGIPASITLAQGIIESSAGNSPLATEANNHFGIKCHADWSGPTYRYDDDRKQECFRKYSSAAESFKDHSTFLKNKSRYAVLFTYDLCDYKSWAKGLKACGYATNPQYANLLIKCINDYDLHQWDLNEEERSKWFAQLNKTDSDQEDEQQPVLVQKDDALESSLEKGRPQDRVFLFNDIKCVTLRRDETLNDVATAYEIGIKRLMRYNDIAFNVQLQPGDRIYLQPKRKNGDEKFHTVQQGETMLSISRDHGIHLEALYEKNLMVPGTQPAAGEIICLRETRKVSPQTSDSPSSQIDPMSSPLAENSADQFHLVTKGDTLYSISRKYNLTVDELIQLNHLYSHHVYVGERLKVVK